MGYICLFDFESAREEDYGSNYFLAWCGFFTKREPTIVLRLNRQKLADKLIPNSKRPRLGKTGYKGSIPFIEVWYPEAIPVSAIDSYVVIQRKSERYLGAQEFPKERIREFDELTVSIEQNLRQIEQLARQMHAALEPNQLKAFIEKIEQEIKKGNRT
jgi:hypothetical protein